MKLLVREIDEADLPVLTDLLYRGFPVPRKFWEVGLARLVARSSPVGMPRFGYVLTDDDRAVGVILLISSFRRINGIPALFANVSSWYVEPAYRRHAALLYKRALVNKEATYLNLGPAANVQPIVEAMGFTRYAAGQFAALPAFACNKGGSPVRVYGPAELAGSGLDVEERCLLEAQAAYGCIAFCCVKQGRALPFVFLPRIVKRLIPAAQLAYCRDLADLSAVAGTVGRRLLRLGRPLVLIDANAAIPGIPGRYFAGVNPKYCKGPVRPILGDLTETEVTILGMP